MAISHKLFPILLIIILTILNCSGRRQTEDRYSRQRKEMVEHQLKARGITNKRVLSAMLTVPRHKFIPEKHRNASYDDTPLMIGYNQTISQPYIIAYMTEKLNPQDYQKVLEIGTGSGYQAAILSLLYKKVYTMEIIKPLGEKARSLLNMEGYRNIKVKLGDGYQGWEKFAPYDAIIVTCAPENVPAPLIEQLAEGGKMIIPVGAQNIQVLYLLEKTNGKIRRTETLQVMFVPMVKGK